MATQLHRFIYEYDDADPYRSAWFMHRLELMLEEQKAAAPAPVPLTDEQDRALCEAHCNDASDEYFKARPQLDSIPLRRIFYAGHRKGWLAAHGIGGEQ